MLNEILLGYGSEEGNEDWLLPVDAVEILKGSIGEQVKVGTETLLYNGFGVLPSEEIREFKIGSLVDVRPSELVIFQDSAEGRTEVVLPVGALRDLGEDPTDEVPLAEDFISSIVIGDKTFTLIDPRHAAFR